MTNTAKNKIFQYIQTDSKIAIQQFDLLPEVNMYAINAEPLSYMNGPMRFFIHSHPRNYLLFRGSATRFSPTFYSPPFSKEYMEIEGIIGGLNIWINGELRNYIEDLDVPDLWLEYLKGKNIMSPEKSEFDEKGMFTPDEKKQIILSLNELKGLVHEAFKLTMEHDTIVKSRLDYLVESVDRLNRFDWKSVAVNTMIAIGVALTLDARQGQELLNLFTHVFRIIPHLPFIAP